jgi:hypothetical protein
MKWIRRPDDGRTSLGPSYASGPWVIRKEFYADGPSLYTWVLYCHGNRIDEATTLRAAKALIPKEPPCE